jgi:hypothetical protein
MWWLMLPSRTERPRAHDDEIVGALYLADRLVDQHPSDG